MPLTVYKGSLAPIPEKWHICDGTEGTPNLLGRFLEGVTASPGALKEAGLPNIKGNTNTNFRAPGSGTGIGALSVFNANHKINSGDTGTSGSKEISFDASRCSSIYKDDCTTVQPASYTVIYVMKIKK